MLTAAMGQVMWALAITLLFVVVIVGAVLVAVNLFRAARRRNTPGWWAAAWIATLLMFFPFVGIVVGLIVLQIERSTRQATDTGDTRTA